MDRSTYIPAERQKKMLEYVEAKTSAQIHELANQFHVSEATVRRDLDNLDQQGKLRRTHGGAMKVERSASIESVYSERINLKMEEKKRIAQRAARMVRPGDTVVIDSGSTTYFIAQALSHHDHLTLITNDLYIAYQTSLHPTSVLLVTGGMRRPDRHELTGIVSENFIRAAHVDIAFISVEGIDSAGGATVANFDEAGMKRLMIQAASRSVLVADHSKFGRVALSRICDLAEADLVLTDVGLDQATLNRLKENGIEVEMA